MRGFLEHEPRVHCALPMASSKEPREPGAGAHRRLSTAQSGQTNSRSVLHIEAVTIPPEAHILRATEESRSCQIAEDRASGLGQRPRIPTTTARLFFMGAEDISDVRGSFGSPSEKIGSTGAEVTGKEKGPPIVAASNSALADWGAPNGPVLPILAPPLLEPPPSTSPLSSAAALAAPVLGGAPPSQRRENSWSAAGGRSLNFSAAALVVLVLGILLGSVLWQRRLPPIQPLEAAQPGHDLGNEAVASGEEKEAPAVEDGATGESHAPSLEVANSSEVSGEGLPRPREHPSASPLATGGLLRAPQSSHHSQVLGKPIGSGVASSLAAAGVAPPLPRAVRRTAPPSSAQVPELGRLY